MLPGHWQQHRRVRVIRIVCRLVAAVPPLAAGAAFKQLDLSTSTEREREGGRENEYGSKRIDRADLLLVISISGLFGFFLAFITPALLQIASKRRCERLFGRSETAYSNRLGAAPVAVAVVVVGTLALGLAIALLIRPNLFG
jgi:hypothetical protein